MEILIEKSKANQPLQMLEILIKKRQNKPATPNAGRLPMYPVAVETVTIITSLEKYALMERNAEMLGSHMDNRWNTIERVWCWEIHF